MDEQLIYINTISYQTSKAARYAGDTFVLLSSIRSQ